MSELAMGTGEGGTQSKAAKSYSTLKEQPATPAYPDWQAFQAYYGPGVTPPPAYFASPVASGPTPPPYMWGGQPLMTPYGTTPPYAAVYQHGGIYTHPSVPPGAHSFNQYSAPSAGNPTEVASISVPSGTETEAKSLWGKGRSSIKKVKGNLEKLQIVSTKGRSQKATSSSANGAFSQSGGSGSEGSSEGSEEDNLQNGCETGRKRILEPITMNGTPATDTNNLAYNAQAGEAKTTVNRSAMGLLPPAPVPGRSIVSLPTTNLNIGMDMYNAPAQGFVTPVNGRRGTIGIVSTIAPTTAQLIPGRDGAPSELCIQDERELKREKRKQSNRESAKRSRAKKQLECEGLTAKVETLTSENKALRNELNLIAKESEKLASENVSLMELLRNLQGQDRVGDSERNGPRETQSRFMQPGGNHYPQVLYKISNSSSSQRDEQRESEMNDSTGKAHAVLEANAQSDTVAADKR
jgi:plant G-box-binding factor